MQRYPIGRAALELTSGDIVEQDVDAIVNAANEGLAAGGGVCGAIFRAAGSADLARACRPLAPCPTGEARLTPGFRLRARHVIHAVGPVYSRRDPEGSARLLASAYRSSLALAAQHGLARVAFPSISTGIFGYPVAEAAPVALAAVRDALAGETSVTLVRFVLWGEQALAAYTQAAQGMGLVPEG
ncbi:MAG: RNase III inhibitor [Chloroflexales bacterium]|nr:RNase III inhibitor [Chloroflexales bacterium]